VRGILDGIAVQVGDRQTGKLGRVNVVKATGADVGISQSHFDVEGRFRFLQSWEPWDRQEGHWTGDFYNSTIDAETLGRVLVGGHIYEDDSDGDQNEIRARRGRFFARDTTWLGWIDLAMTPGSTNLNRMACGRGWDNAWKPIVQARANCIVHARRIP